MTDEQERAAAGVQGTPSHCPRCGRYEDGLRQCPNGDPACPVAAGVNAPERPDVLAVALDALKQCQANMPMGNTWHVAADAIMQIEQAARGVAVVPHQTPCTKATDD
jgi:hypothetical protein